MHIKFTKMQALGNDFVVLDLVRQQVKITREWIAHLADRHLGIGCDQVLVLSPAKNNHAHFDYRIFNPDGTEVYQCGNGARCIGLFIQQEQLSDEKVIYLATQHQVMSVSCIDHTTVQVDIAKPDFNPAHLPFNTSPSTAPYSLSLAGEIIIFSVVNVGNPHCVIQNHAYSEQQMRDIGEQLNAHAAFPAGVNVGFVNYDSRDAITLRVYERGAGLTKACGSGACAAVAIGVQQGRLNTRVTVAQLGGLLHVFWESYDLPIQLRGSATRVFDGYVAQE